MTIVYPVSTQLASYDAPEIDIDSIERIAQYCVNRICRKWFVFGALYREHRDDMRQTAINKVYEEKIIKQAPEPFIFQRTMWTLEEYIWTLILGRGRGAQWDASRHVYIESGYDESYEGEADSPATSLMRRVSRHRAQMNGGYHNIRPVEDCL